MPEQRQCIVLYRGSLERSRLAFLMDAITQTHQHVVFIWLFAGQLTEQVNQIFQDFITSYHLQRIEVLNHRFNDFFKTKKALSRLASEYRHYNLALIGDSACLFSAAFAPDELWWFINGIPEEAVMHGSWKARVQSRVQWWLYKRAVDPDCIVTVSRRMSSYINQYFPYVPAHAMPTCVDGRVFSVNGASRQTAGTGLFVYLGTGAPWQSLDQLSAIWQQIHARDKGVRFRVISRDPRCRILASGVASSHIEFLSTNDFNEVASFLRDAEVGFIIRRDSLVNRVAFPTKLGEYIATGCWVVATDLDWDISDYIREYEVGFNAPVDAQASELAEEILKFRSGLDWTVLQERIANCANALDRKLWTNRLVKLLANETSSND